ncbi:MAG: hypothetical protein LC768_03540 [Acidobacteria bacterium]|nr:hypothetical protein [Acidobacteriota bacterium]MCA1637400.1 hypothetical protein [Acidobacteriota bacterium]
MTTEDNNIQPLNNEIKPVSDYFDEYRGKQERIIKKVKDRGETAEEGNPMFDSEMNKLKKMFKTVRMADYGHINETDVNTMRLVDTDVAILFQFLQVVRNQ